MTPAAPCQPSLHQFSLDEQVELAEMLDRYLLGWEAGEPPSISQWVQDRPAMEDALRQYIEQLSELQDALKPASSRPEDRRSSELNWPTQNPMQIPLGSNGPQRHLGDYQILSEIGRGGMGIVYRARQLSLGRDVAIKTLPFAAVLDPKQIKRFQNEAQAAAQLHHPNIVPVYAVGCERGVHYYSMQLIEGVSLEQVINDLRSGGNANAICQQTTLIQPASAEEMCEVPVQGSPAADTKVGPLSSTLQSIRNRGHIESTVRLGIQAAEALHYAHQCGVIHRDIKPSNLMIDGRANLWITDFGLARCQQTTPMSVTGDLMGTLRYMSPEQASGRVHAADHRTDIYSLGITLYELLTLQLAFDAPNRIELITLISQTSPVSPRKINPAVPADVETILGKAISHEPLERYDSAGEMAEDLHRFLRGEQPLAKRPTCLDHSLKWAMRHKHLFLVVAASLLMLISGLALTTIVISSHQRAATAAGARAELHLAQTNRVVQNFGTLMLDRLSGIQEGEVIGQDLLGELKNYYLDFIRYAKGQRELVPQLGEAHFQLAGVFYQTEQFDASREHYDRAIEVLRSLPEGSVRSNPGAAPAATQLACAYGKLAALQADGIGGGDWQASLEQAILLQRQMARALPGDESKATELVGLIIQRGDLLLRERRDQQAVTSLLEAIQILDSQLSRSPVSPRALELDTLCHNNLASIHQNSDPKRAARLLQRAIGSAEKLVQAQPAAQRHRAHLSRVLANSAALAAQAGQPEQAERQFELATDHWAQLAKRFPHNEQYQLEFAANQNSLGQFLLMQRRWDSAEPRFLGAIQTLDAIAEQPHASAAVLSDLASVQNNLGLCYEKLGRFDDAAAWFSRSLRCQRQALSQDPQNPSFLDRLALHRRNLERLQTDPTAAAKAAEQ